eukprot:11315224-Alexandrium_andersonii.AAC.1
MGRLRRPCPKQPRGRATDGRLAQWQPAPARWFQSVVLRPVRRAPVGSRRWDPCWSGQRRWVGRVCRCRGAHRRGGRGPSAH